MKKNKRCAMLKKVWMLGLLIMVMTVCAEYNVAYAKNKNVTKSFRDKKKIETMVKDARFYLWSELMLNLSKGESKTVKFSNEENRKELIGYCIAMKSDRLEVKKKYVDELSRDFFGMSTNTKGIYGGVITGLEEGNPKLTVDKVVETGKDRYSVTCTFKTSKKINGKKFVKYGTFTCAIKKNTKSSYGYVLTSIKFKKTAKNPKWLL